MSTIPLYDPTTPRISYCSPEVYACRNAVDSFRITDRHYAKFCCQYPQFCNPLMIKETAQRALQQVVQFKSRPSFAYEIITTRSTELKSVINDKDEYGHTLLCHAIFAFLFGRESHKESGFETIQTLLNLGASLDITIQTYGMQSPMTVLKYIETNHCTFYPEISLRLIKLLLHAQLSAFFNAPTSYFRLLPAELQLQVKANLPEAMFNVAICFDKRGSQTKIPNIEQIIMFPTIRPPNPLI